MNIEELTDVYEIERLTFVLTSAKNDIILCESVN